MLILNSYLPRLLTQLTRLSLYLQYLPYLQYRQYLHLRYLLVNINFSYNKLYGS